VKDAEFIYSLYVQANPVPDPDLLPLTRDEAVLLTSERSPDMITAEKVESPQPPPPRRRRLVAALGAAAILIVAVVGAAILVGGESKPIAAAEASPVVIFDGVSCSYEGPTLIGEGSTQFSLANSAAEVFDFTTFRMVESALLQELEEHPVGTDWAEPPGSPLPVGEMSFVRVAPGETYRPDWILEPGAYLFECTIGEQNGGIPEHVWRIAQVEVVAASG
jgi:hypothetical protein